MGRLLVIFVCFVCCCLGAAYSVIQRKWTVQGHIGDAQVVKYSPNGRYLVSGGTDNAIRIWNADNGRFISQITNLSDVVGDLAFSPDGTILASISHIPENGALEHQIFIWNFPALTPITQLSGHDMNPQGIAFSPNGQFLASAGSDNRLLVWSTATWSQIAWIVPGATNQNRPFFSSDSTKVGSVDFSGDVSLYNIFSQTLVYNAAPPISSFLGGSVVSRNTDIGFFHSFHVLARMNLATGSLMGQAASEIMQSYAGSYAKDGRSFLIVGLPFTSDKPEIEIWNTSMSRLSAYDTQAGGAIRFPFYVDCRPGRSNQYAVAMRNGEVFVAENPHVKLMVR